MGLFSKLKDDVTHGGVKISVQVPSSIASNEPIPVTVTITSDDSRTINSVKAELKAQAREQGIGLGGFGMEPHMGGIGTQQSRTMYQTVAQVESREPFTVNAGEPKTVNLQLYLNGSPMSGSPLGQLGNSGGVMGGILKTLGNLDHVNYLYRVDASAQIEGVGMDPSDNQAIQLLPPSQTVEFAQPTAPLVPGQSSEPTQQVTPGTPESNVIQPEIPPTPNPSDSYINPNSIIS